MAEKPLQFRTLVEAHIHAINSYADQPQFGTKINGKYQWMTFREFGNLTANIRAGLAYYGVTEGDCVATISNNCVEWGAIAYATYGLNAHYTTMYENQLKKDWEFIITDSKAKVLFVADARIYDIAVTFIDHIETLQHVFIIKAPESNPKSLQQLIQLGAQHPTPIASNTDPNQLASLIYTSGTTGTPKGVMLSHANICANIRAVKHCLDINTEHRSLSFLPWAHVLGQTLELHIMSACGASVGFVESVDTIIDNLAEVQPTILVSVPRIFNRLYAKIQKDVASKGAFTQKLFKSALDNSSLMRSQIEKYGKPSTSVALKDKAFDYLIFSKIRDKFGGKLKFCFSGGAALSPEVATFIDNLHITVFEGYGLTETSPIVAANSPLGRRIGSIGLPMIDVEVKTIPAEGYDEPNVGEICVRGPNVMLGYLGQPDKTKEVIDEEGWFHTGDLGRIDKDGFIWLIGRVKEQYKLENGKYVVPAPLEERLQLSKYIEQAVIEGSNRRYNVAVFVLNMEEVGNWAAENGITVDKSIFDNEQLNQLIKAEIDDLGSTFKGYEKPRKWILTDKQLTTQNGLLTPSLKIKRREFNRIWGDKLNNLYQIP